jgi:hypothetical protein
MPKPLTPPLKLHFKPAITHHGTMPNNLDLAPTSMNLFPQQLIVTTANIPPTIDDLVGEFFQILELEFPVKSFGHVTNFFRQKDETLEMLYKRLLKLKEDTQNIVDLEVAHWYLRLLKGTSTLHAQVL